MSEQDRQAQQGTTRTQQGGAPREGAPAPQSGAPRQGEEARQYVPRPSPGYDDSRDTGGNGAVTGFTVLAGVVLMLSGIWSFLVGLAGIIKGQFFVVLPNYAYSVSTTGWGWTHLIIGVLVFAAGAFVLMDMAWARIAGVVLAALSAIASFIYIPYTPVWSIVVIALDVFVIWALLTPHRGQRGYT